MSFRLSERARSFRYAWRGIWTVIRTQPNTWIHLVATVGVVALGFYVKLSAMEWSVIVLTIALVWVAEAANTAIEFLADALTQEHNEWIGHAKDVGAGAVLLAAMASVVIGVLIFIPHILALIER